MKSMNLNGLQKESIKQQVAFLNAFTNAFVDAF